jgi:hypothetical protein
VDRFDDDDDDTSISRLPTNGKKKRNPKLVFLPNITRLNGRQSILLQSFKVCVRCPLGDCVWYVAGSVQMGIFRSTGASFSSW